VITLRRQVGFEAAAARVKAGRGKQLMDDIRKYIAAMQAEERLSLSVLKTGSHDQRDSLPVRHPGPHLLPVMAISTGDQGRRR
jgi:hypothetical protein